MPEKTNHRLIFFCSVLVIFCNIVVSLFEESYLDRLTKQTTLRSS